MRSAECGVRSVECGLRIADCGLRIADCGVWSLNKNKQKEKKNVKLRNNNNNYKKNSRHLKELFISRIFHSVQMAYLTRDFHG